MKLLAVAWFHVNTSVISEMYESKAGIFTDDGGSFNDVNARILTRWYSAANPKLRTTLT